MYCVRFYSPFVLCRVVLHCCTLVPCSWTSNVLWRFIPCYLFWILLDFSFCTISIKGWWFEASSSVLHLDAQVTSHTAAHDQSNFTFFMVNRVRTSAVTLDLFAFPTCLMKKMCYAFLQIKKKEYLKIPEANSYSDTSTNRSNRGQLWTLKLTKVRGYCVYK